MSIAGFSKHNNIKVTLVVGRLQHSKHSKTTSLRHHGASSSWTLCTNLLYHPCLVLILGSNFQLPQTSKQFWQKTEGLSSEFPQPLPNELRNTPPWPNLKGPLQVLMPKNDGYCGLRLLSNNFCQIRGFYKALAASWAVEFHSLQAQGARSSHFVFVHHEATATSWCDKSTAVVLDGLIILCFLSYIEAFKMYL